MYTYGRKKNRLRSSRAVTFDNIRFDVSKTTTRAPGTCTRRTHLIVVLWFLGRGPGSVVRARITTSTADHRLPCDEQRKDRRREPQSSDCVHNARGNIIFLRTCANHITNRTHVFTMAEGELLYVHCRCLIDHFAQSHDLQLYVYKIWSNTYARMYRPDIIVSTRLKSIIYARIICTRKYSNIQWRIRFTVTTQVQYVMCILTQIINWYLYC